MIRILRLHGPVFAFAAIVIGAICGGYVAFESFRAFAFKIDRQRQLQNAYDVRRGSELEKLIRSETADDVYKLPCREASYRWKKLSLMRSPADERLEEFRNRKIDPWYPERITLNNQRYAVPHAFLGTDAALLNCGETRAELNFGFWLPDLTPVNRADFDVWGYERSKPNGFPDDSFVAVNFLGPIVRDRYPEKLTRAESGIRFGRGNERKRPVVMESGYWRSPPARFFENNYENQNTLNVTAYFQETAIRTIIFECVEHGDRCSAEVDFKDIGLSARLTCEKRAMGDPEQVVAGLRSLLDRWHSRADISYSEQLRAIRQ